MYVVTFFLLVSSSALGLWAWFGGRYGGAAAWFLFGGMFAAAAVHPLWEYGLVAQIIVAVILLVYVAMTTVAGIRWTLN